MTVPATAGVCVLLAWEESDARSRLIVWALMVPFVVLLVVVDHGVQRLPDVVVLPLVIGVPLILGIWSLGFRADMPWLRILGGGVAYAAFHFILLLVRADGLGFGDVKFAMPLGGILGWHGWRCVALGILACHVLAALYVAARRSWGGRPADRLSLGPFMALGVLVGLLA
ncbi:prepilin peptidase [Streptomyces sp. NPDC050560]|uniref:prepilin peptidase n=1 Tax=Streptomyces sp. NPDC050560 TaxID=3365630 RepID=UPI0037992601